MENEILTGNIEIEVLIPIFTSSGILPEYLFFSLKNPWNIMEHKAIERSMLKISNFSETIETAESSIDPKIINFALDKDD